MVAAPVKPAERQHCDPEAPWPCFEQKRDWQLYLESRKVPLSPCYECLPDHQADMLAKGRCLHPETVFFAADGEIIGVPGRGHDKSRALARFSRWRELEEE